MTTVYSGDHPANIAAALAEIAERQLSADDREYLLKASDAVTRLGQAAHLSIPIR